jgi:hypothetical protein
LYDGSNETAKYGAICKIGSRINHRCALLTLFSGTTRLIPSQLHAQCDALLQAQLFLNAVCRVTRHQSRRTTLLLVLRTRQKPRTTTSRNRPVWFRVQVSGLLRKAAHGLD